MNIQNYVLRIIFLTAVGTGFIGCSGGNEPNNQEQELRAQNYVAEIINIMRSNAVTRYQIDWVSLEDNVYQLAANAKSIKDTYPAITRALELIETNHSFLMSEAGNIITYPSTLDCSENIELIESNTGGIGYIRVDGFSSRNNTEALEFAANIQAKIAEQDDIRVTAWVVDLRNNTGGNMWPMVTGLGPLFDGELLGHFIDPDESIIPWGYKNGSSFLGESLILTINEPYSIFNPLPKIAVLTSKRVGSSGEATVIAFKKQINTRMFGSNTCGLSTANIAFPLSDGSQLFLTTAVMADREQEKYGGRVEVDEIISQNTVMTRAISWLQE